MFSAVLLFLKILLEKGTIISQGKLNERDVANLTYNFARQHDGTESSDQGPVVKNSPFIRDDLFVLKNIPFFIQTDYSL